MKRRRKKKGGRKTKKERKREKKLSDVRHKCISKTKNKNNIKLPWLMTSLPVYLPPGLKCSTLTSPPPPLCHVSVVLFYAFYFFICGVNRRLLLIGPRAVAQRALRDISPKRRRNLVRCRGWGGGGAVFISSSSFGVEPVFFRWSNDVDRNIYRNGWGKRRTAAPLSITSISAALWNTGLLNSLVRRCEWACPNGAMERGGKRTTTAWSTSTLKHVFGHEVGVKGRLCRVHGDNYLSLLVLIDGVILK